MADDLDRLEELLDAQEAAVRQAFLDFVATVKSEAIIAALVALIEADEIEKAFKIIDSYVIRMGGVLGRVGAAVGEFTSGELMRQLGDVEDGIIGAIDFDPNNPRAAEIMRTHTLEFVTNFSDQQRNATRQALDRAFQTGQGAGAIGAALKDSIGLTAPQELATARFRAMLESLNPTALQRDYRNRRFDRDIKRAIETGRPLTPAKIDQMVEAYRQTALRSRAEMIARTEGTQAASEARDESLDQMIEQTGVPISRIVEMWNSTRDKRTRAHHASMNGQTRAKGVPFTDGLGNSLRYPGDPAAPASTRIHCRCVKTFSLLPRA